MRLRGLGERLSMAAVEVTDADFRQVVVESSGARSRLSFEHICAPAS